MYGDRDRVVKLRVTSDELTKWTAAATRRDERRRVSGVYDYPPSTGLSGLIRAAVETAIKPPARTSRRVATTTRSTRRPRRRGHTRSRVATGRR